MTDEFVDVIRVDNPLTSPTFRLFSVNVGNLEDLPDPFEFDPPPEAPQPLVTTTIDVGTAASTTRFGAKQSVFHHSAGASRRSRHVNQTTAYWFRLNTRSAYASPTGLLADQVRSVARMSLSRPTRRFRPSRSTPRATWRSVSLCSAPGIFPSAYYALRTPSDPPGTLRDSVMLAEGFDAYELEDFNGFVSWGRHTGLAIDPVDDVTFWTFNAYSLPRFDWTAAGEAAGVRSGRATLPVAPPPGPTTIRGVVWQDLNGNGFRDERTGGPGGVCLRRSGRGWPKSI
jgi:hypothetical protein